MIERHQVIEAYRLILGREPESDGVIDYLQSRETLESLGERLLSSEEFRRRAAVGGLRPGQEKWVCAEIRHGLRLWIDLMDAGVGAGALRDQWEPDETRFVLSHLDAGSCFVDIGANIGWFTVLAAHRVGAEGRVHAFEPRPDLFRRLTASVMANGFQMRCVLHNVALGDTEGEMNLASVPEELNPGHSFLLREGDAASGVAASGVAVAAVRVCRLDDIDIDRRIDLVKIDVEGAEALALRGGRQRIARDKPFIVSEFFPHWLRRVSGVEPGAYLDLLRGTGYRIFELTAEGPGDLISDLPRGVETDGFYTNIIAEPEGRGFRSVSDLREPVADAGIEDEMLSAHIDVLRMARQLRDVEERIGSMLAGQRALEDRVAATELRAIDREREIVELTRRFAAREERVVALESRGAGHEREIAEIAARLAAREERLAIEQDRQAAEARHHAEEIAALTREFEAQGGRAVEAEMQARGAAQRAAGLEQRVVLLEKNSAVKLARRWRRLRLRIKDGLGKLVREVKRPFTAEFRRKLLRRLTGKAAHRGLGSHPNSHASACLAPGLSANMGADATGVFAQAKGPVVMIIDDRWPEPDRDSGSLDAVNMVRSFKAFGYHVLFGVQTTLEQDPKYVAHLRAIGSAPITAADAPSLLAFIERDGWRIDLFVLSRVGAGGQYLEMIRHNCPHAKIIFNTVDLHYVRERRTAGMAGDTAGLAQAERTREREQLLARQSDLTIVVSSVEQELLREEVPEARTALLPLAREVIAPRTPFARRSGLGFVGGFAHQPNIDAIRHFLSDVWPLIHQADPSIRFDIVGSDLPDEVLHGVPGEVRYLGSLPSLDDWLDGLRMTVAPLRIGAGAKGKVASSLCAGLPCVLSSVAAEGMELTDGHEVLIGRDPADMAAKILRLHADADLWDTLSRNGLAFAEQRLSVGNYTDMLRRAVIGIEMPAFNRRIPADSPALPA